MYPRRNVKRHDSNARVQARPTSAPTVYVLISCQAGPNEKLAISAPLTCELELEVERLPPNIRAPSTRANADRPLPLNSQASSAPARGPAPKKDQAPSEKLAWSPG